ncbi:hypothetical protein V8D89_014840 [Ganoderma adspersum]
MFLNHHHPTGPATFLVAAICIITFTTNFAHCLLWLPCIDEITFLYLLHHLKHIYKKTRQDPPLIPRDARGAHYVAALVEPAFGTTFFSYNFDDLEPKAIATPSLLALLY